MHKGWAFGDSVLTDGLKAADRAAQAGPGACRGVVVALQFELAASHGRVAVSTVEVTSGSNWRLGEAEGAA